MKYCITGAGGYIGWTLANTLANAGHEVRALDIAPPNTPVSSNIEWMKGSVLDPCSLKQAFEGCSHVYHCAGIVSLFEKDPEIFYSINVDGTQNVLDAAVFCGVKRVVFTSSAGVIGHSLETPLTEDDIRLSAFDNHYDLSKHLAEEKARAFARNGLEVVIVNPPRVFGPGKASYSNAITRLAKHFITSSYYLVPGNGEAKANYAFVEDVVHGHIGAMHLGRSGQRYTLGGHNLSYNELYKLLQEVTGLRRRRIAVPVNVLRPMAYAALGINQITGRKPFMTPKLVTRFTEHRMLSSEKALAELDYKITDIRLALKKTVDFIKDCTFT
jgi:nucleoside-diphosphate-sugar epimerase